MSTEANSPYDWVAPYCDLIEKAKLKQIQDEAAKTEATLSAIVAKISADSPTAFLDTNQHPVAGYWAGYKPESRLRDDAEEILLPKGMKRTFKAGAPDFHYELYDSLENPPDEPIIVNDPRAK